MIKSIVMMHSARPNFFLKKWFWPICLACIGLMPAAHAQLAINGSATVTEQWSVTVQANGANLTYSGTETGTLSITNGVYAQINRTGFPNLDGLGTKRTISYSGGDYTINGGYPITAVASAPGGIYAIVQLSFFAIKVYVGPQASFTGPWPNGSKSYQTTGASLASLTASGYQVDGNPNGLGISAFSQSSVTGTAFAPYITVQPSNRTVAPGSNAALSVTAAGNDPLRYQWKHAGTNISDGALYKGTLTSTLTITNAQFGHTGDYLVIVTNVYGSVTSVVATLNTTKTDATVSLGNLIQNYDGTAKRVSVTTVPPGLSVVVTYNGSITPPVNIGSYSVTATVNDPNYSGSATGTLVISPAPGDGSWTQTGSMIGKRAGHAALLLPDGRVLAVGTDLRESVDLAEIYDPSIGTWKRPKTGFLSNVSDRTATLLADGRVLIAGGSAAGGNPNQLYEPATEMFLAGPPMNTRRTSHSAVRLPDGKVLVAGGYLDPAGQGFTRSSELFDPQAGVWATTGALADFHTFATATLLIGGKVLLVGTTGLLGGNSGARAELYDPITGNWSLTEPMVRSRSGHTATLLPSGLVLVAGGSFDFASGVLSDCELFNPVSGAWTATASMGTARLAHTATLLHNGKVLVTGGAGPDYTPVSSAEVYDPQTGRWSAAARMATPRKAHTATLLADGRVLVAGGTPTADWSQILSSSEVYDPGPWSNVPPSIRLAVPVDGNVFPASQVLLLEAEASDSDGFLARVEFFEGTNSIGLSTTAPYRLNLSSLAAGAHVLTAKATDSLGASTVSIPITIYVVDQPRITAIVISTNDNQRIFRITCDGTSGIMHRLEASSSLLPSDWMEVGTGVPFRRFLGLYVTNTLSANPLHRFFRFVVHP